MDALALAETVCICCRIRFYVALYASPIPFFAGPQRVHSWVACRVALTAPTLALLDFVTDWVFEKLRLLLLSLFCS